MDYLDPLRQHAQRSRSRHVRGGRGAVSALGVATSRRARIGYLAWRDTKAALVLFVRTDDATKVETKAVATFEAHPLYKRRANDVHGFPTFIMRHDKDVSRELTVALVFVPIIH